MKAAVRVNALTLTGSGNKTLATMQRHGNRDDATSQKRRVREVEPIVYGSLDLQSAFDAHVKDCKMNASLKKPVMHALIQFPVNMPITPEFERLMLRLSVQFINERFGGRAAFAGRLDRDEAGRHTVDVFYSPKYTKVTKNRQGESVSTDWISTTKHGKEHCEKHRAEIMSRNDKGKFTTTPRSCGIALQTELHEFFAANGIELKPKVSKAGYGDDRAEVEAYKKLQDAKVSQEAQIDADREKIAEATVRVDSDMKAARVQMSMAETMMDVAESLEEKAKVDIVTAQSLTARVLK